MLVFGMRLWDGIVCREMRREDNGVGVNFAIIVDSD